MTESPRWTVETLKEYFDRIIDDRDRAIRQAQETSLKSIEKAEERLNKILEGFPQTYGSKTDLETLETEINRIKADHVQRRELAQIKNLQEQGRGGRTAITAVMGIVVALIAVALGSMYSNQLTNKDVSIQIEREAPWVKDRPEIENELKTLEKQVLVLNTELERHKAEDDLKNALSKKK